jgi:transcription initiation factor TFIIIB Brf1 subunit/transcription initiation factor TFIIB
MLDKDGEDQLDRSCEKRVLKRVQAERNILHTTTRTKAKLIGHILYRNCLLQHVIFRKIEKRIEVTGRRERRLKQILVDLKSMTGKLKLKEEALDRTLWGKVFGRDNVAAVRLIKE